MNLPSLTQRVGVPSALAVMLFGGVLFLALNGELADAKRGSDGGSLEEFSPYVDPSGRISLPMNYKTEFVHLGSWFIPGEGGQGGEGEESGKRAEGHTVFTQKSTVEAFKRTGEFPDGAVLVKSVRAFDSATLTTGNAHWAAEQKIWFVMVKDTQDRFPGNPLWAESWGWALFQADEPSVNVATDFRRDCYACHLPRQDKDWVYTEGYPTLRQR